MKRKPRKACSQWATNLKIRMYSKLNAAPNRILAHERRDNLSLLVTLAEKPWSTIPA